MITTGIAIFLMAAAVVLALYTFWDNENRLYGNIVACALCWIICFMLALMFTGGTIVQIEQVPQTQTTINETMTVVYTSAQTPVIDNGMGYLFGVFGLIMLIYNALLVFDIVFSVQEKTFSGRYE